MVPQDRADIEPEARISVALVTCNRCESLERSLLSWRAQTIAPFEIVVADDSTDQAAQATHELAMKYGCKYIAGPRLGLYANRNSAALACSGTHILTDDDDHSYPTDYLEKLLQLIKLDRQRIWTIPERDNFQDPNIAPNYPTELHRSGAGCLPRDPANCAAIADGSTLYPRAVFDSGLRYDETYRFGTVWYLWGKILSRSGWRISISDATFVWHHALTKDRYSDVGALKEQMECTMYVLFVNALWINPSILAVIISCIYLLRRMLFADSILGFGVRTTISCKSALRMLRNVIAYPKKTSFTCSRVICGKPPGANNARAAE